MAQTYSFGDILAGRVPANTGDLTGGLTDWIISQNQATQPSGDLTGGLTDWIISQNQATQPLQQNTQDWVNSITGDVGPGGITPGSYNADRLAPEQRQWLWQYFGHTGNAPSGYGGEGSGGGFAEASQTASSNQQSSQSSSQPVNQNPAQTLIDVISAKYENLWNEYNQKLSDFDKANPFVYDTILAEETSKATQRLDPYYTQTLSDFLTGIDKRKSRSLEDEKTLITELNTDVSDYTGREKINLSKALNNAREEGAASGMYSSGTQLAGEGEKIEESQYNLERYMTTADRQKKAAELATKRLGEDLSLEESQKKRDLERERQAQIQSQALTETLNTQKQREIEKAEVVGAPPGENLYSYLNSAYG